MKFRLATPACLLLLLFTFQSIDTSGNNTPTRVIPVADSSSMQPEQDTIDFNIESDSLKKMFSLIFRHLRSRNEELERALVLSNRTTALLLVLFLISILIVFRLWSGKRLFSAFPHYRQKKGVQPGLICLQIMTRFFYGRRVSYKKIQRSIPESKGNSLSINELDQAFSIAGFDCKVLKVNLDSLYNEVLLPVLLYLPNHMAVLYAIKNGHFYLSDPYHGYVKLKAYYFVTSWFSDHTNMKGIVVQLFPVKPTRRSLSKKYSLERFAKLKSLDKKFWKDYVCEVNV